MQDFFKSKVDGGVAWIEIDRVADDNKFTRDMMTGFTALVDELAASEAHVIAITAKGPDFSLGRDGRGEKREGLAPHQARKQLMGPVLDVYRALSGASVPTIACVQGRAIGFGCALAGSCDITLASDAASFSFPEIEHGIPPTLAMSAVSGKVPAKMLSYLIYSADTLNAVEARGAGLVSKVLPAATFAAESKAFVDRLAARPKLVLETIKKYQRNAVGLSEAMASEYAGTLMATVR